MFKTQSRCCGNSPNLTEYPKKELKSKNKPRNPAGPSAIFTAMALRDTKKQNKDVLPGLGT